MKKFFLGAITVLLIAIFIANTGIISKIKFNDFFNKNKNSNLIIENDLSFVTNGNVKYRIKAEGNFFNFYDKGKWEKKFLKGVNIGASTPGIFPGELTVSYNEYYSWFEQISKMNANCIRVYTTMRPQFYNALYDFNKKAEIHYTFFKVFG